MIGSAELGEIVMRAFILRRVALIEGGGAGSVLVGGPSSPDTVRLQGFLGRNGYPYAFIDATEDAEGRALVERLGVLPAELPIMLCPNGTVLKRPTNAQAGVCLGMTPKLDPDKVYDVAIAGAGPAGLAAAVYAASEGLSVLVLDQRAFGGQAGASARIENYLGFPSGISGMALAGRAFNQALKFGAEIAIPLEVAKLDCGAPGQDTVRTFRLQLTDGAQVQARTVVIASGARYRRPPIPNLDAFDGRGISYWASPVEAKLCEGEEVALVGGGNSAGQAVVFLAPKVKRLHLVVRGPGLEASMSRYLIDRIAALPNVVLHTGTEVAALEEDASTGSPRWFFASGGRGNAHLPIAAPVSVYRRRAERPLAQWVRGSGQQGLRCDRAGNPQGNGQDPRPALPLETSRAGIFAIGDVRSGSVKRVAAAVGEGAAAVAQIHTVLAAGSAH